MKRLNDCLVDFLESQNRAKRLVCLLILGAMALMLPMSLSAATVNDDLLVINEQHLIEDLFINEPQASDDDLGLIKGRGGVDLPLAPTNTVGVILWDESGNINKRPAPQMSQNNSKNTIHLLVNGK